MRALRATFSIDRSEFQAIVRAPWDNLKQYTQNTDGGEVAVVGENQICNVNAVHAGLK
jgi:hypothetical protein